MSNSTLPHWPASAAAVIAEVAPVVAVLMNNAGVMFTPFGRIEDGFEMQFGTNHLGHFVFTTLLRKNMEAADGSRVVDLSSEAHHLSDIDLDDANWERRVYDKFDAYGAAVDPALPDIDAIYLADCRALFGCRVLRN